MIKCGNTLESQLEEVPMNILQYQVSLNIHSKAGVFKYIIMEIPLLASVALLWHLKYNT